MAETLGRSHRADLADHLDDLREHGEVFVPADTSIRDMLDLLDRAGLTFEQVRATECGSMFGIGLRLEVVNRG